MDLNKIYLGDCLEVMKTMPDNSIDVVVTSPPYGVGKFYEQSSKTKSYIWKTVWLAYQCFKEFKRIVKPGGYIVWNFGDSGMGRRALATQVVSTIPMGIWYWRICAKTGFELQATRVWTKPFASVTKSFVMNFRPRPCFDYEHIWTFRKPDELGKEKVRENKIGRRGTWSSKPKDLEEMGVQTANKQMKAGKRHGAAFPEHVPFWALTVYSDPGMVVLDPFMGTGTTAVVCEKMGRNWVGIDNSKEWYDYANERIEKVRANLLKEKDLEHGREGVGAPSEVGL